MASSKHEHKAAIFEDGTHVVLRLDPSKPRIMEVIATFYSAEDARDYIRFQSNTSEAPHERRRRTATPKIAGAKPKQAPAAKAWQVSATKVKQPSAVMSKPAMAKSKRMVEARATEAKLQNAAGDISDRQTAVLKALRSLMDKNKRVEVSRTALAKASSVPLGTLHSTLASLEKKRIIKTERQGSPKHSAIYQVLEASQKGTRTLNGAHSKVLRAGAVA